MDVPYADIAALLSVCLVAALVVGLVLKRNARRQSTLARALTGDPAAGADVAGIADDRLARVLVKDPLAVEAMVAQQGVSPTERAAFGELAGMSETDRAARLADLAGTADPGPMGSDGQSETEQTREAEPELAAARERTDSRSGAYAASSAASPR